MRVELGLSALIGIAVLTSGCEQENSQQDLPPAQIGCRQDLAPGIFNYQAFIKHRTGAISRILFVELQRNIFDSKNDLEITVGTKDDFMCPEMKVNLSRSGEEIRYTIDSIPGQGVTYFKGKKATLMGPLVPIG